MQKPPQVLHKWGENIRNLPLRIRTNCIVCAMESACRGLKLRGWPVVRWPSVWSPMAIGRGWGHPFRLHTLGKPSSVGHFWRVDFSLFKSCASCFRVVFNDLRGAEASKIAYFQALPLSHGNTRFLRTEYTV